MTVSVLLGTYSDGRIVKYDGTLWTPSTTPSNTGVSVHQILRNPSGLILATNNGATVYLSSVDDGVTWVAGANSPVPLNRIASNGFQIGLDEDGYTYDWNGFTGTPNYIRKSPVAFNTWANQYPMSAYIQANPTRIQESDATWASLSRVWWTESYASGRTKPHMISSDGIDVELTDPASGPLFGSTLFLLRGIYDSARIYAFGNFFDGLWYYDPAIAILTNVTLPTFGATADGIYSFVPFSDSLWFLSEYVDNGSIEYGQIWKTDNAGVSWTMVLDDVRSCRGLGIAIGPHFIARNPTRVSEMISVAIGGVFHSTDTGSTWTFVAATAGLITTRFSCVQWLPGRRRVAQTTLIGAT